MCPLWGRGKVQQGPLWRLFQAKGAICLAPGLLLKQDVMFDFVPVSLQEEPGLRRSGREPRPSALRAGEEWEVREALQPFKALVLDVQLLWTLNHPIARWERRGEAA